ncbi:MAG TPA: hypothetical protein VMW55_04430 [Nitrosopumilaceae archaeon]|nr:hypothetical protein [Nitrosopumilaceae archaeon]
MKISYLVIISVVLSISLPSVYGQDESRSNILLNFDFINPEENQIQEHIDYKITVSENGVDVFGPSLLTHSTTGEVTIPLSLKERQEYDVLIEVHGILFHSIPFDVASFSLVIPDENSQRQFTEKKTLKIYLAINKDPLNEKVIPQWVKTNAGWWTNGDIDDKSFIQGIQYLMKEKIIDMPKLPYPASWMDKNIPLWVKNNASWWADDLIPEEEFIKGIKYLVEKGIIQV